MTYRKNFFPSHEVSLTTSEEVVNHTMETL